MSSWAALVALVFSAVTSPRVQADVKEVTIIPPDAKFHGKTYPEWAAAFWQYAFALPLEGHPFSETPGDFRNGQKGSVWFWSAPDFITRDVTLPSGKALFLTIRDIDTSSLEAPPFFGLTEEEQRANSAFFADHIIDVFVIINGVPVTGLENFRFSTPQFEFTAPTPWIFGEVGGTGTAVGDGYFLMLQLPKGQHTIRYGGTFFFTVEELGADEPLILPKDVTINITVGN